MTIGNIDVSNPSSSNPPLESASDATKSDLPRHAIPRTYRASQLVLFMQARPFKDLRSHPLAQGTELTLARNGRTVPPGLTWRVSDATMSRPHARVVSDKRQAVITDLDSKNGTFVNGVRIKRHRLRDGDVVRTGSTLYVYRTADLAEQPTCFPRRMAPVVVGTCFDTFNLELAEQFSRAARAAKSSVPVLIRGATGTGKELAAREMHELSGRRGPFVAVNCGALADNLIESELFGCRKGAFSGANENREGLIRRSSGGTLFLDEVAEMSPTSQVALLRVLQEREVRPVGDQRTHKVDLRVIAATHQDLEKRIAEGRFREDLYARIAGFTIALPPLVARREDLGLLLGRLIGRHLPPGDVEPQLTPGAVRALFEYTFPLNIRELDHAVARALTIGDGRTIRVSDLPPAFAIGDSPPGENAEGRDLYRSIVALLSQHRGNVSAVARAMGKAPVQIRRWCRRFDIDADDFRNGKRQGV